MSVNPAFQNSLTASTMRSRSGPHGIDSAKLWDLPTQRVPIGVAVSGDQSVETFAPLADAMVAVEPDESLVTGFDAAAGVVLPKIGQQPICWDANKDAAVARAHEQFRWFAGGWKVNAELPGTSGFEAASQFVRPEDVAQQIPCGTDVALVQIGGDAQQDFLKAAGSELLPELQKLS